MVQRICAPNPSPMTLGGTNGYVIPVGPGALVAIDPGIDDAAHIGAFLSIAARAHAQFVAIFVTHGHADHYPGALALRRATRAPIFAHRSATFEHDRAIDDGMHLTFEDAAFVALHTPGHAPDHLTFWHAGERALFTGDLVIGSGTVLVAPPDGDMRAYVASLRRLLDDYGHADVIYGGHGPTIRTPHTKLKEYIAHRQAREAGIVAALERAPATIPALVNDLYADISPLLGPAAAQQIFAHLIALMREGRVAAEPLAREPSPDEEALLARTVQHEMAEPFMRYSLVTATAA
jgi:glyoxylase-like metal-dependent hydrolase (beta-lactamase superfamily II)